MIISIGAENGRLPYLLGINIEQHVELNGKEMNSAVSDQADEGDFEIEKLLTRAVRWTTGIV